MISGPVKRRFLRVKEDAVKIWLPIWISLVSWCSGAFAQVQTGIGTEAGQFFASAPTALAPSNG